MEKFICQQCGNCCDHIRGRISDEEKEFIKEYAYGKLPIVQLMPVEQISFPLWDWEAKRLKEWQKQVNIDAKIKPLRAILDINTNEAIILTYYMDSDSCPFLKDNKCLIYNTNRAYICRLFPFQRTPFLKTQERPKLLDLFGTCPAIEQILPNIPTEDEKEMIRSLYESFGDSFLNAIQNDYITQWVNSVVVELCKNKVVRPAMNYPYDKLMKRIENAEKIDFTDFLIKHRRRTEEDIKKLIQRFDENLDAKEKLMEILK